MADPKQLQAHHHHFAASTYNLAADIVYDDDPSDAQIASLIELAHVSHWHWEHRDDKKPSNISVAYWMLSKAYAANGFGDRALEYGEASLAAIQGEDLPPWYLGFCHEVIAKAHLVRGDQTLAEQHRSKALELADQVTGAGDLRYLLNQINRTPQLKRLD